MSDQTIARTRPVGAGLGVFLGLTLLGLLAIMWLALSIETTTFWTANNIANLLRQTAFIAILAIGQTFVIITASISPSARSKASSA
jgi:ribose transport system permease protein